MRVIGKAMRFVIAAVFVMQAGWALAQERSLVITEGADYFGLDYDVLRDVDQSVCEAACIGDNVCVAFTYNTQARWCFLKSSFGDLRAFEGAVSGRITTTAAAADPTVVETRLGELSILPTDIVEEARVQEGAIAEFTPAGSFSEIMTAGDNAVRANDLKTAADLYRSALALSIDDRPTWIAFARAAAGATTDDWQERQRLQTDATAAAINAYLRSTEDGERAEALGLIASSLAMRAIYRPAIRAYRAAAELDKSYTAAYEQLRAEQGFRIVDNTVDSDAAAPRICVVFSDNLSTTAGDLSRFVTVDGGERLAIEAEGQQICVDGVEHGGRYHLTVRADLPAFDGEVLPRNVELDLFVRDRAPQVRFVGRAYVLPAGGEATIPVVTVNTTTVEAEVIRYPDRRLVDEIGDGNFLGQLSEWQSDEAANRTGESVWSGTVEVTSELNREVTTAIPVGELVESLEPGVYALLAGAEDDTDSWSPRATQWFIVTDIGLATLGGTDGLHVFARSLGSAAATDGLTLTLIAANNEILGTATTDAEGYARFDAGLSRGTGSMAPTLLTAESASGDYAFLDLTKPAFDLADRGVEGRTAPGALDIFMSADRGVYRPGETAHVLALARDGTANAVEDVPLTFIATRPDGVEHARVLTPDEGAGGRTYDLALPDGAMRGTWRVAVHADPEATALAETSFLVEDFVPERLDFELEAPAAFTPGETASFDIAARYLYGAPASGLGVEGEIYVRRAAGIAGAPGYSFGLSDESFDGIYQPVYGTATDETGAATVEVDIPDPGSTSLPLEVVTAVRVLDTSGRPVERSITVPLAATAGRIGIDPQFDGAVEEGGNARFRLAAFAPDGSPTTAGPVQWVLDKIDTNFQWYRMDGSWDYQAIRSRSRVASGTVDSLGETAAAIEAAVEWGEYELTVTDASGALLPASMSFEAGWYVAPTADETPDALRVSLDKEAYRVGETAEIRIEPRFAGVALVMVVDNRLIDMVTVDVPEGGATVELPVTSDWGPGAYVTAALFRPMDLEARRMPARALGLHWASVDPEDRALDVAVNIGASAPRGPLEIEIDVANVTEGETAYVTVAAVDLGILNLTQFEPPAPEEFYFGQRRLGMEIRDLYGQLIDRMLGVPGVVRSGGDGSALGGLEGTPPTERLVAFFEGPVEVGADGKARVAFDLPDFNGTVRVMATAWSATAVGHAVENVVVRDPVVVTAALPAFMQPGDTSRLLLDITHAEGPVGPATVSVEIAGSLASVPSALARRQIEITETGRIELLVPIEALGVGDETITVSLTAPGGEVLTKVLTLPIRANEHPVMRESEVALAPGGTMTLDGAPLEEFIPGTSTLTLTAGNVGGIDLPALVRSLQRYPYGCAEQITSVAMPLLYLDDVVAAAGLDGGEPVRERVEDAIAGVLANQSSNGSFGLWGPGSDDLWLNAYVTDFLTRAREKGYDVPAVAYDTAVQYLRNSVAYAPEFESGGEDVAYALYVLARNGRASIGDLRYYAETRLDNFATPLAKAQLGAALALYGDRLRAETAFAAAVTQMMATREVDSYRGDYGTDLRDSAAILTLASETDASGVDLAGLTRTMAEERRDSVYFSTQERAWMLLAANALMIDRPPQLEIDGAAVEGTLTRSFSPGELSDEVTVVNRGKDEAIASVTATGVPLVPEPAGGNGYAITRSYFDLDGNPVDGATVGLGDRLVVVLTVTSTRPTTARLVVDDPLPAGFEIDNPNLIQAGDVAALDFLGTLSPARTEFRADRFVAAVDYAAGGAEFQLAYMVRAISPGEFAHPAAIVEDMYRPEYRARTDSGSVEVVGPVQ